MGMGWEQLEQPGAAADAHQPSRLFGTLFAAHPSMSHAESGVGKRRSGRGVRCYPRHITP